MEVSRRPTAIIATVGALVAVAAATQLGVRLTLPLLLGRYADRSLMAVSAIGLACTFALLILSTTLPVFVAAQLLGAHGNGHTRGGGPVRGTEVLVGHPHPSTAPASRTVDTGRRCVPCALGLAFRLAPVPPSPGRLGPQVVGPFAHSATAMHISSTRLLLRRLSPAAQPDHRQ